MSELDLSTFHTLTENALDAIILADAKMIIIYANRAAYQLFGLDYAEQALLGMPAARFWQEKDLPFLTQTIVPQAIAGGWAGEVQNMRCDGSVFDALASVFLVRGQDGQSIGMAVILRDITARQQSEEALRTSEENLRMVFENMQDTYYRSDMTGTLTQMSLSGLGLLGGESLDQLIGHKVAEFYADPAARDALVAELRANGKVTDFEVDLCRLNGEVVTVSTNSHFYKDRSGKVAGIEGIFRDVTARKQAEKALRASEERFKRFSSVTREGMVFHEQGIVIDANPAIVTMVGYSDASDIIGKPVLEFIAPDKRQIVTERIAAGGSQAYEAALLCKDGTSLPVEIIAETYPIEERTLRVAIFHDLTTRKQAEAALVDERNFANTVLDSLPGVFYLYNTEGRLMRWNKNFPVALEMSEEDLLGGYFVMDNIAEEYRGMIAERMQCVFTEGSPEDMEAVLVSHKGKRMPYFLTGRRVIMDNQVYLTGIGLDLTANKQAEAEAHRLQEQIIEAQRHALQELSTPIIPVLDRIIVMPLIGSIDTLRAKDITRALLAGISQYRAKIVIVDITGVPLVDSGVADHLNKTIQAARLKGAQTIITGMSDAVAEAIIDLGIDWSGIQTLSDLQTGLMVAINTLGLKLVRNQ